MTATTYIAAAAGLTVTVAHGSHSAAYHAVLRAAINHAGRTA